jgi:hypothetical protein
MGESVFHFHYKSRRKTISENPSRRHAMSHSPPKHGAHPRLAGSAEFFRLREIEKRKS